MGTLLLFYDRAIEIASKIQTRNLHRGSCMKLISSLVICLALSACATNYASQLSEPHYGLRVLNSDENVDPALLMNGIYATRSFGAFCLTRCSQQPPLWSSGFAP
jgi:hypothetical protein